MATFGISVDSATAERLDAMAQELQTSRSTIVRWAIKYYLAEEARKVHPTDRTDETTERRS